MHLSIQGERENKGKMKLYPVVQKKKKDSPQHPFIESESTLLHYLGDKGDIKSLTPTLENRKAYFNEIEIKSYIKITS